MSANLGNSTVTIGLEKFRFHSNSKEGQCQRMIKLPTIELISHASKVTLKIFQLDFCNMLADNFQMCKLDFKEVEEPEIKLTAFIGL